jgi:hypothetical protein
MSALEESVPAIVDDRDAVASDAWVSVAEIVHGLAGAAPAAMVLERTRNSSWARVCPSLAEGQ